MMYKWYTEHGTIRDLLFFFSSLSPFPYYRQRFLIPFHPWFFIPLIGTTPYPKSIRKPCETFRSFPDTPSSTSGEEFSQHEPSPGCPVWRRYKVLFWGGELPRKQKLRVRLGLLRNTTDWIRWPTDSIPRTSRNPLTTLSVWRVYSVQGSYWPTNIGRVTSLFLSTEYEQLSPLP